MFKTKSKLHAKFENAMTSFWVEQWLFLLILFQNNAKVSILLIQRQYQRYYKFNIIVLKNIDNP